MKKIALFGIVLSMGLALCAAQNDLLVSFSTKGPDKYADGTTAAETYTATLNTGDAYSVVSPVIEGYRTDLTIVEGIMPARNVTVTVIYVLRPAGPGLVTIDDFMTPLGLGLGGLNIGDCVE